MIPIPMHMPIVNRSDVSMKMIVMSTNTEVVLYIPGSMMGWNKKMKNEKLDIRAYTFGARPVNCVEVFKMKRNPTV